MDEHIGFTRGPVDGVGPTGPAAAESRSFAPREDAPPQRGMERPEPELESCEMGLASAYLFGPVFLAQRLALETTKAVLACTFTGVRFD